ncbi:MAG: DUF2155 domain-containing protein [Alphaproteobacteria bacterium]|nr:DUF2155 domain-containing protein [Alphaproteobacteria bacterium]
MKKILVFLGVLGVASVLHAKDIETEKLLLRAVDKITGRVSDIHAAVGRPARFGDLVVTPHRCLKKPPEETPENAAFLHISEKSGDGAENVVFNGWMFSSNPALSAMDHAVYGIWVIECVAPDMPAPAAPESVQPALIYQEQLIREEPPASAGPSDEAPPSDDAADGPDENAAETED